MNNNTDKISVEKWDTYDEVGIGVGSYTDMNLLEKYNKGLVLDMGCGRGRFLSNLPNSERYGVDMSGRAIQTARSAYPSINFKVGSVTDLPFDNNFFDFIYSLEVIEHVKEYDKMLSEMVRVVKPGGYIFIQTPNYPIKRFYDFIYWIRGKRSFWDDYTHVSKFPFWSLKKTVKKHAQVKEIYTRNLILENQFPFIKKIRKSGSLLSLIFGQKTVIVAQKSSNS